MKNVTLAQPGTKKEIIHISAKTEKINGIVQGDVDIFIITYLVQLKILTIFYN